MRNRDMPAKALGFQDIDSACRTAGTSNIIEIQKYHSGLTKLEYAAIHALQGIIANNNEKGPAGDFNWPLCAYHAVKSANALFDELEKQRGDE